VLAAPPILPTTYIVCVADFFVRMAFYVLMCRVKKILTRLLTFAYGNGLLMAIKETVELGGSKRYGIAKRVEFSSVERRISSLLGGG